MKHYKAHFFILLICGRYYLLIRPNISILEKGEYSKLYDYLKSKKVKVTASGKSDGGKLSWEDNVTEKGNVSSDRNKIFFAYIRFIICYMPNYLFIFRH